MNTKDAADYCGVTESILLYVARRDGIGRKEGRRWSFTADELDQVFGGSAPFVARLREEKGRVAKEVASALLDLAAAHEIPFEKGLIPRETINKMNKATARRLRQLAEKLG